MLQMRVGEFLLFELRQPASRRDCITDLSTVHIMLGQVVDVICEIFEVYIGVIELFEPVQEIAPDSDFARLGHGQILVVQG